MLQKLGPAQLTLKGEFVAFLFVWLSYRNVLTSGQKLFQFFQFNKKDARTISMAFGLVLLTL